ncbi:MAG: TIGR02444 family protein [Alphaproteobacteria bacterium]
MSDDAVFWDHSLAIYRRPGFSQAAIALQDRRGVDVNILLLALWRAATGAGALGEATLAKADATVLPWRGQVTERLRAARNAIKAGIAGAPPDQAEALRKDIVGGEIEAERIAHAMLAAVPFAPAPSADGIGAAARSFAAYARFVGFAPGSADQADFRTLLAACFPDAKSSDLDRALAQV